MRKKRKQKRKKMGNKQEENIGRLADTIIQGDALAVLRTLPEESVHCVITSPPYY